jgi:uncharacterized membrane protein
MNISIRNRKIVFSALVGALYAVLTLMLAPLSYGIIQCRVSEALTVLPFFSSFSVIGLGVGCLVANLLSPIGIPDIIFGSLATLAAAYVTYKIGKSNLKFKRLLAPLPAVIINGVVVGILLNIYSPFNLINYLTAMGSVALGELIPCYLIGIPLITLIEKNKKLKDYLIF